MKKKDSNDGSNSSKNSAIVDQDVPSIEEQLKGKNLWKMLGEVGPGEEFARLRWVYGKGKRRRDYTVILKKSEHPVSMEQVAREFAKIITPAIYRYMEEHPEIANQKKDVKPKKKKASSTGRSRNKKIQLIDNSSI
ncbi:MAG: hypothetical protein WDA22_10585 [Bacteroidota bacterium]